MACQFQSFDESGERAKGAERLAALRRELVNRGLDGFIVPRSDEHQGEYVPPGAERLAWLTGFTGSAGTALVLAEKAAVVVDGRYDIQVREQVDTTVFTPVALAKTSPDAWIATNLPTGGVLGYDPWLHTAGQLARLEKAVARAGGRLVAVDGNPLDAVWQDRPAAPDRSVVAQPLDDAGEPAQEKIVRLREVLEAEGLDALVISDPHNLGWAFNLRGSDIAHTPVALGYALLPLQGEATIFIAEERIEAEALQSLEGVARFAPRADFAAALTALANAGGQAARLRIDADTGAAALSRIVKDAGGEADVGPDPITLMKAVKNAAELAGSRAAHLRDGLALSRFLAWVAQEAPTGLLTEIDAVEKLEEYRRDTGLLVDISFATIAGANQNAALPHYHVTRASNRFISEGILLVDSGGQYRDGTTDITRTIAIGTPSVAMREHFTRVLKGHIAIATAVFPAGTSGAQIDAFARRPLWEAGLDFDHGTGHGIGAFLSVHEGPQRISKTGSVALEPGMILSNEPGYYREGHYGIRIENLLIVEKRSIPGGERSMLGFETVSLAPIDTALIEPALLTETEIDWLNAYHARVAKALTPLADGATRRWLQEATRPLSGLML